MTTITTRAVKGSPLSWSEADANFNNLNTDKLEDADLATALVPYALLNSPTFTGIPTVPTAATGTSTTQVASTAFVNSEIDNDRPYSDTNPLVNNTVSQGISPRVSRQDHVHPVDTSRAAASAATATGTSFTPAGNIAASTVQSAIEELDTEKASVTNGVPAGAMQMFFMNTAPTGWLSADGAVVSRTTYAALFTAIGTTYGAGDGSTTFGLPDMRGYFPRASGTNGDGVAAGTFGAKQAHATKDHTHYLVPTASSTLILLAAGGAYSAPGGGSLGIEGTSLTGISNTTGVNSQTETRPSNIALLACIKT